MVTQADVEIFAIRYGFETYSNYLGLAKIVMASKSETQGIVLPEAASNELPIVVLDSPVVSDFIKENGVGFIANKKNFSEKVEIILNNKKAREKIIKSCKKISEKYDIDKLTDKLLELYNSVERK